MPPHRWRIECEHLQIKFLTGAIQLDERVNRRADAQRSRANGRHRLHVLPPTRGLREVGEERKVLLARPVDPDRVSGCTHRYFPSSEKMSSIDTPNRRASLNASGR